MEGLKGGLPDVPRSTVHYWARQEILVPSVSSEPVKLWLYPDLMGLRIIYWLRQRKTSEEGHDIPRSAMSEVRRALAVLEDLDMALWSEESGPAVGVACWRRSRHDRPHSGGGTWTTRARR